MMIKITDIPPDLKRYIDNDILSLNEALKIIKREDERRILMKLDKIEYKLTNEVFDAIKRIKNMCEDSYCVACPLLQEDDDTGTTKCVLRDAPYNWNFEVSVTVKI